MFLREVLFFLYILHIFPIYNAEFGVLGRKNWNWHFREIMDDCDHTEVFDLELCLGVSFVKRIQDILIEKAQQTCTNNCATTSKLRTFYAICGLPLKADVIVTTPLLKSHRSVVAKLMCGTSNLEIERGRHKKIPRENRICILCQNMEVEDDEVHFILKCPFYDDLRNPILQLANLQYPELTDLEQLKVIFQSKDLLKTASFCLNRMYNRRSQMLTSN